MKELQTLTECSYREHPAFSFEQLSWEVPNALLMTFNTTYKAASYVGAQLNEKSFAILRQTCLNDLNKIFASMQEQGTDQYEKQFLSELQVESTRLLDGELTWHFRQHKQRFIDFGSPLAQEYSLKMMLNKHFFGCLSQQAVQELSSLATSKLIGFRANANAGRLTREDLTLNGGATIRAMRSVLNREFKSLGVLDAISSYVGRNTQVLGLALELSVPQASWWKNAITGLERPPKTLYAHVDESISFPKAIVYLSDVAAQNGPTGCYPGAFEAMQLNPMQEIIGRVLGVVGNRADSPLKNYYAKQYHQSMNSENFRRHFMKLPECLRFNSHLGWDVMPDSELESTLADNERKMTGAAGTFIAFDGARLLHRGGLMEQGERVALQVIFSDMTFMERTLDKVKRRLV